jgi:tRNA pseudouridine55 synthase
MDFLEGQTLLFNKPKGWTSFDVVKKVRNLIGIRKVGHAGTLDPLATGLLILCTGKHTKQIEAIQAQEKEYEVIFKLGATTASYDAEHPEEHLTDASAITREAVMAALPAFTGEIEQVPPVYSAVKVAGQRAYQAARKGETVEIKSRKVHVYAFSLLDWQGPEYVSARIRCSKGTYIRSLVHDLGQAMGVGAYILELKRTRIGDYRLADAWDLSDFEQKFRRPNLPPESDGSRT